MSNQVDDTHPYINLYRERFVLEKEQLHLA